MYLSYGSLFCEKILIYLSYGSLFCERIYTDVYISLMVHSFVRGY